MDDAATIQPSGTLGSPELAAVAEAVEPERPLYSRGLSLTAQAIMPGSGPC